MKMLLLSLCVATLCAVTARASDDVRNQARTASKGGAAAVQGTLDAASTGKEKPFLVFCTGSCSRTFRKHSEYATVADAMRFVREYKGKDVTRFWIATGDESRATGLLLGSKRAPVESCSIYAFSPRCGCRLQAKTKTVLEAEAEVATLDRDVWAPAIVYHLK